MVGSKRASIFSETKRSQLTLSNISWQRIITGSFSGLGFVERNYGNHKVS